MQEPRRARGEQICVERRVFFLASRIKKHAPSDGSISRTVPHHHHHPLTPVLWRRHHTPKTKPPGPTAHICPCIFVIPHHGDPLRRVLWRRHHTPKSNHITGLPGPRNSQAEVTRVIPNTPNTHAAICREMFRHGDSHTHTPAPESTGSLLPPYRRSRPVRTPVACFNLVLKPILVATSVANLLFPARANGTRVCSRAYIFPGAGLPAVFISTTPLPSLTTHACAAQPTARTHVRPQRPAENRSSGPREDGAVRLCLAATISNTKSNQGQGPSPSASFLDFPPSLPGQRTITIGLGPPPCSILIPITILLTHRPVCY